MDFIKLLVASTPLLYAGYNIIRQAKQVEELKTEVKELKQQLWTMKDEERLLLVEHIEPYEQDFIKEERKRRADIQNFFDDFLS